jgi:SAM-dependent methyltransferase
VDTKNYAENFGLQWQAHAKTQLDSHNGSNISEQRLYETSGWPHDLRGEKVLEAGSGAGRFTEVLAKTGASVFSFDYSSAVIANYKNNGNMPNVCVFQGDIYKIPFADETFDRVLCYGVLQHTPDVKRTFVSIASKVKPGGYLTVDVYPKTIWQMVHWKYMLRPLTTRISPERLYKIVRWYAPKLIPVAKFMKRVAGRAGHRLVPILDQSDKPVSVAHQIDWTVLDTYDALSAVYDQPQTDRTIIQWYADCGFTDIRFKNGAGSGRKRS